jgi:L-threonylcarbamoyladenylate synthase
MPETLVLKVNPEAPESSVIGRAAEIIRAGGLVAFPTETVYGLGADATNADAVNAIFKAKGRPQDNPLIVHVADREMLLRVAASVSEPADRLIEAFWPGPLTLVLKRNPNIPPEVSAGLDTIAVRMPRNRIALELIRRAGLPLAAPSANFSGGPSPTCAEHVRADLTGRVDLIIDGGKTNIGIESTVLDMTGHTPTILRPGWVTPSALRRVVSEVHSTGSEEGLKRSPGTRYRHYSPRARVILVESGATAEIAELCKREIANGLVGLIGHSEIETDDSVIKVRLENNPAAYATAIYAAFRELDEKNVSSIVVEAIAEENEGAAVMDRLRRAASEVVNRDRT